MESLSPASAVIASEAARSAASRGDLAAQQHPFIVSARLPLPLGEGRGEGLANADAVIASAPERSAGARGDLVAPGDAHWRTAYRPSWHNRDSMNVPELIESHIAVGCAGTRFGQSLLATMVTDLHPSSRVRLR